MIVITSECIMCAACEPECPVDAISEGETQYVIDQDLCTQCQACMEVCPTAAIIEK